MKINAAKIILAMVILCFNNSYAQSWIHGNINFWFLNLNRIQINKQMSFTTELHERTGSSFNKQGQILIRPSFDFHLSKHFEFSIGYSYIHIWPYSPYSLPIQKTENNLWEQILLKFETGKFKIQNRLRQENRWYDHISTDALHSLKSGIDYSNRFRFRITINYEIYKFENKSHAFFLNCWNEYWFLQDTHLRPVDFNRNWFYAGVGYYLNSHANLQLGYLNQIDKINSNIFIQSDVIQFTFQRNFEIQKK